TEVNEFGLFRVYSGALPTHDPEDNKTIDDYCDSNHLDATPNHTSGPLAKFGHSHDAPEPTETTTVPFPNKTVALLMNWYYAGSSTKTVQELDHLVHGVICHDDFNRDDLRNFRASRETKRMDDFIEGPASVFLGSDGWKKGSVSIALPRADSTNGGDESSAPRFKVDDVWHRSIVDIVIAAWQDPASSTYHLRPYHLFYEGGDDRPPERVYGEAYVSDLFMEMDTAIQMLPPEPGCTLERIPSPLMLWSDSTHLTNFGTASMWPIYIQLANQSKYVRIKPTAFASHHLAYLPSVCHKFMSFFAHGTYQFKATRYITGLL
ncbi:hypothetical protein BGW80DRAFT_1196843, partial [Lactifluus volemus]